MQSSLKGKVPKYVGADLTDRYSGHCRDVDVCGLTPAESGKQRATFWYWHWDPAPKPLDVAVVAKELAEATVSMMDGPQALAIKSNTLRLAGSVDIPYVCCPGPQTAMLEASAAAVIVARAMARGEQPPGHPSWVRPTQLCQTETHQE